MISVTDLLVAGSMMDQGSTSMFFRAKSSLTIMVEAVMDTLKAVVNIHYLLWSITDRRLRSNKIIKNLKKLYSDYLQSFSKFGCSHS